MKDFITPLKIIGIVLGVFLLAFAIAWVIVEIDSVVFGGIVFFCLLYATTYLLNKGLKNL